MEEVTASFLVGAVGMLCMCIDVQDTCSRPAQGLLKAYSRPTQGDFNKRNLDSEMYLGIRKTICKHLLTILKINPSLPEHAMEASVIIHPFHVISSLL